MSRKKKDLGKEDIGLQSSRWVGFLRKLSIERGLTSFEARLLGLILEGQENDQIALSCIADTLIKLGLQVRSEIAPHVRGLKEQDDLYVAKSFGLEGHINENGKLVITTLPVVERASPLDDHVSLDAPVPSGHEWRVTSPVDTRRTHPLKRSRIKDGTLQKAIDRAAEQAESEAAQELGREQRRKEIRETSKATEVSGKIEELFKGTNLRRTKASEQMLEQIRDGFREKDLFNGVVSNFPGAGAIAGSHMPDLDLAALRSRLKKSHDVDLPSSFSIPEGYTLSRHVYSAPQKTVVLEAENSTRLGHCVMKIALSEYEQDRLDNEAKLLGKSLKGVPGLPVYVGSRQGWLALEQLRGRSLHDKIDEAGRLQWDEFRPLLEQLCKVVIELHKRGVIHHDIKPGNIWVDDGRVTLIDLGSAAQNKEETTYLGTSGYAPERQKVEEPALESDDAHAIASTLARALTRDPRAASLPEDVPESVRDWFSAARQGAANVEELLEMVEPASPEMVKIVEDVGQLVEDSEAVSKAQFKHGLLAAFGIALIVWLVWPGDESEPEESPKETLGQLVEESKQVSEAERRLDEPKPKLKSGLARAVDALPSPAASAQPPREALQPITDPPPKQSPRPAAKPLTPEEKREKQRQEDEAKRRKALEDIGAISPKAP